MVPIPLHPIIQFSFMFINRSEYHWQRNLSTSTILALHSFSQPESTLNAPVFLIEIFIYQ